MRGSPPDRRTVGRRIRHRLEWWILQRVMVSVRRGDIASAYARLHRLAAPLRQLLRSEWRWVHFNLRLVYGPHITPHQCRRLAAMVFENVLRSHVDGMRIDDFHWDPAVFERQLQPLITLYRRGGGAILCGVHLGSWEVGLKLIAQAGIPLGVVYRHANNPLSERAFRAVRAPYGVQWIRRDDPRALLRVLRDKRVLVLMTDINQRHGGVAAPYLGVPALCPVGAARLARRFGVPMIPGVCLREAPGQVRFHFGPPLTSDGGAEDTDALIRTITRLNQSFEGWVHDHAEQYNWLHARWRSRPDGTLWRIKKRSEADRLLATCRAARQTPYPHLSERVQQLVS